MLGRISVQTITKTSVMVLGKQTAFGTKTTSVKNAEKPNFEEVTMVGMEENLFGQAAPQATEPQCKL